MPQFSPFAMLKKESRIMNQELRDPNFFICFKKNKMLLGIFTVILASYFLLLTHQVFANVIDTQTMPVSAFVGPQPRDYQFNLVQQDGTTNVSNGKYYAYTITYGAKDSAKFNSANTIITFDWSQALAPNGQIMFDYVYGSASDGYGGAKPVVDIVNKTISWTIPNLPAGTTDQKLVFQLFANSYDKTANAFPLYLTATMTNDYLTMPAQQFTDYYQYQAPPPGPTATPGPAPTATPTPPPPPPPLYSVEINGITQKSANIAIDTRYPSKLNLSYGTSPTDLSHTISSNENTYQNKITLSNLTPDTKYYFQFTITSEWGYATTSEIYTFQTAKPSPPPNVDSNIVVFSSNGTVFFSETQKQIDASLPSVILTADNPYTISYTLAQTFNAKSIDVVVTNASDGTTETKIPMTQKTYNLYIADLQAATPGLYNIYVLITDSNGNIMQKQIAALKIMPRLTVYAQDSNQPLSDARIFLYYFDDQTDSYLPLSASLFGNISNPSYTDDTGELSFTLPPGKYRADESALFYDSQIVNFTIGPGANQNFPQVYLKYNPANLISSITFLKNYLSDTVTKMIIALRNLASSVRLFHIFAVIVVGSFSLLSFLLFLLRSHIKLAHLPVFLLFGFDMLRNQHKQKYIYGTVSDEDGRPISRALIEIEDTQTKNILAEAASNKLGKFYFRNSFSNNIGLIITKPGFAPVTISLDNATAIPEHGLLITLLRGERHHISFFTFLWKGFEESFGLLFEASLVISILLELLFFFSYGFTRTLPFLALSVINIILWLFYLKQRSEKAVE